MVSSTGECENELRMRVRDIKTQHELSDSPSFGGIGQISLDKGVVI
jgi:hypothetical protein